MFASLMIWPYFVISSPMYFENSPAVDQTLSKPCTLSRC